MSYAHVDKMIWISPTFSVFLGFRATAAVCVYLYGRKLEERYNKKQTVKCSLVSRDNNNDLVTVDWMRVA